MLHPKWQTTFFPFRFKLMEACWVPSTISHQPSYHLHFCFISFNNVMHQIEMMKDDAKPTSKQSNAPSTSLSSTLISSFLFLFPVLVFHLIYFSWKTISTVFQNIGRWRRWISNLNREEIKKINSKRENALALK